MSLFRTDSLVLSYSDVEAAKRWWIATFDCKAVKIPADWDNPLASDVALKLPGYDEPTILLNSRAELEAAGFDASGTAVPILFCDKLEKAQDHLSSRGVMAGPIQADTETEFFEIRDLEGNTIEICKEP